MVRRGYRQIRPKRRIWLSLLLGVSMALGVAGCGSSTAPAAKKSNTPYVLGASLPETGPYSSLGVPEVNSAELAVKQINAAGGINGHPLKLIVLDNKTSVTTGVQDFKQLIQNDHPIGLIGGASTGVTMGAVPVVEQAKIPLISLASDAEIIQPVSERQWVFKVPAVDTTPMQVILNYLKDHNISRVAFAYGNFSYGTGGLADFKKVAPAQGVQVVATVPVDMTATDATPELAKLKTVSPAPQAVVVWDVPPSADIIAKGYAALQYPWPIFFSDGVSNNVFLKLAGPAVNGAFVTSTKLLVADQLPNSDPQKAVLQKYISTYNQAYEAKAGPANMFGGFGYDAVYMFADALKAAGANPTPTSVRNALEHLNYNGVTGVMHLTPTNHNGLDPKSEILIQVVNQQWKWVQGYTGAK